MKSWDPQFIEAQLHAETYRVFLRAFFRAEPPRLSPKVLSYQKFALRAGLASRSFLNDVIIGKKRLTPNSIGKVALGLGLNAQWTEYLRYLVSWEEPAFQTAQHSREYFLKRLRWQRAKLGRLTEAKSLTEPDAIAVFLHPDFTDIYAALGDLSTGETIDKIAVRANLPRPRVEKALEKMEKAGFLKKAAGGAYVAVANALEADNLRSSEVFKADLFRSLEKTKQRFKAQADSPLSLFMTQTVSVSLSQLPKLRAKMADLIVEFADAAEKPAGDAVAEICVSLTHNR